MKQRITFFEVMVYIAYTFYFLLGLVWFIMSFSRTGVFNVQAFFILGAFGAQFYYKNRLMNLLLGILSLFLSIWMLMSLINSPDPTAKTVMYDPFTKGLMVFCLFSIFMSIMLLFSYIKLSFKDR